MSFFVVVFSFLLSHYYCFNYIPGFFFIFFLIRKLTVGLLLGLIVFLQVPNIFLNVEHILQQQSFDDNQHIHRMVDYLMHKYFHIYHILTLILYNTMMNILIVVIVHCIIKITHPLLNRKKKLPY